MTERNAEHIQAEMAALKREMAAIERPHIEGALTALKKPGITTLIDAMTAARDALPPSQAQTQINNVITVLVAVPSFWSAPRTNWTGCWPIPKTPRPKTRKPDPTNPKPEDRRGRDPA